MDYRIVTLQLGEDGRFDDEPLRALARDRPVADVQALPLRGEASPLLALVVAVEPPREPDREPEPALDAEALRTRLAVGDRPVFDALLAWRRERAARDALPAYMVLGNRAVATLAATRPRDRDGLLAVPGIGPVKLARYGEDLLGLLAGAGDGEVSAGVP